MSINDIWHKVDDVPEEYSDFGGGSSDVYFVTYRDTEGQSIELLAKERFGKVVAISQDMSLRGYYVFI